MGGCKGEGGVNTSKIRQEEEMWGAIGLLSILI